MTLQKLARELDETARQTASMLEGITDALELLAENVSSRDATVREAISSRVGSAPAGMPGTTRILNKRLAQTS